MRPPRIAILVFFLAASLFLICRALTSAARASASPYPARSKAGKSVWGFMYYNTPFSLFPPNAAISLTDDNSTSFAARPAAFGPKLAPRGLSGQLWVGSGFAEDAVDSDGELGCSDLPGWDTTNAASSSLKNALKAAAPSVPISVAKKTSPNRDSEQLTDRDADEAPAKPPPKLPKSSLGGGTDGYPNGGVGGTPPRHESAALSSHADIQSIQEAAEIEGKIVLLKRGGCGFLEKVMWAQRRGAVAVVVGDNQKGGPLIQMFAHGEEVDNVTIPSVFTARTTAHLLSSLTQPGSFIEDTLDDDGNPVLKVQQGFNPRRKKAKPQAKGKDQDKSKVKDKIKSKQQAAPPKPAASPKAAAASSREKRSAEAAPATKSEGRGWVSRVFRWREPSAAVDEKSRPPSSGHLDWVLVEDWSDEKDEILRDRMGKKSKDGKVSEDGFHIGVQDWRDPDLVDKAGSSKSKTAGGKATEKTRSDSKDRKLKTADKTSAEPIEPKGGSITPGSGEYRPRSAASKGREIDDAHLGTTGSGGSSKKHGFIAKMFGHGDEDEPTDSPSEAAAQDDDGWDIPDDPDLGAHEGLWVTITPTSSASPFFDTLLVLVISPLVTLTVVYALLVLRARIRRRRWRAPKSVVERLPVRTYHTVASSRSSSPRLPTPSTATPTTPLLQQQGSSRSRPRSRTTTGVPESPNFLAPSSPVPAPQAPSRNRTRNEHEKGSAGLSAEWRKYMGRQVECVVCLEEYVDGVSRVMSLPCGHEFHADCITPWLTTRRRTCPICKGDVVRSMAHGSSSTPRYEPYQDDSDAEPDAESSGSRPSDQDVDLEEGPISPSEPNRQEGWLGMLSSSFGSRPRSSSPPPEDRDR